MQTQCDKHMTSDITALILSINLQALRDQRAGGHTFRGRHISRKALVFEGLPIESALDFNADPKRQIRGQYPHMCCRHQ